MVTDVYQYDPYGQVTLGSTKHTDFYGYNAESYNPNTGLEYLRARYYNAEEGRFFHEDTYLGDITDPLTLNRYAYVKNSPLNYVDPSGHEPIDEEFLKPQKPSSEDIAEETGLNDWLIDMMLKLETSMQKRELEKNMKEAQKKAEVDKCGTAILTDKLFSFMISLIYGGIAAVLDNEMAMVTLPAGMAGKDTHMFRENAANELAYNIGALIGDIFSIIEGLSKVISGITGAAAGAALAAQSGGATITVSGSGLALAADGMLITISGASNAAKIMISEATSHGGGKNEGDSETKVSKNKLKHINNRHNPNSYAQQIKNKSETDVLKELENKTFFNKDWSKEQIEDAVNTGYKEALEKGVSSGQYTFSYGGENVTIALENGGVKTAFGDYKYTYQQLMELIK